MSNIEHDDDALPEDQINPAEQALNEIREKIDSFDFERAIQMMSVQEKVATTGVQNSAILGLAGLALNEMNDEAKALRAEYQAKFAEAEAERQRLITERQQREAEEQDAANQARALPVSNYDPTPGQPARDPKQIERPRGAGKDALQNKVAPPDDKTQRALNLAGERDPNETPAPRRL